MPAEQLASHLAGFQGYLEARCSLSDPDLLARVGRMKQCLGVVVEPDFDEEGRWGARILALADLFRGICFLGGAVYASDGERLAWPRDEEAEEEEASAPERAGPVEPPTAERVARRALVLGAVAARAMLEQDPHADREERRQWLLRRVEGLGLGAELEPAERRALETPAGRLAQRQTIEGSWRSEGLAVLAWALGMFEPPAHDTSVNLWELISQRMELIGDHRPLVLSAPRLRPPEELKRMERRLFVLHWRLRDFSLRPGPMDFAEFARTAWFGPFDIQGLPLADGDLAIAGLPIAEADEERVHESQSIAMERHQAINWLLGRHETYSQVDTST